MIELVLIFMFWSLCLLVGTRLMVSWIWSPFDFNNIEPKPLVLGIIGSFLVITSMIAANKR
jgi:hypothetical protein